MSAEPEPRLPTLDDLDALFRNDDVFDPAGGPPVMEEDGSPLTSLQSDHSIWAETFAAVEPPPSGESVRASIDAGEAVDAAIATVEPSRGSNFEVAIPWLSEDKRAEYVKVDSDVVELVTGYLKGWKQYVVEFTDGRKDSVSFDELSLLKRGIQELHRFNKSKEKRANRKRKIAFDADWESGMDEIDSDLAESDTRIVDDTDGTMPPNTRASRSQRVIRLRRTTSTQPPRKHASSSDEDMSEDAIRLVSKPRRRKLRQRETQRPSPVVISTWSSLADAERDELDDEPQPPSDNNDDDFQPVISDLAVRRPVRQRPLIRVKRARLQKRPVKSKISLHSDGSDIEFEQPRRSSRATRNTAVMLDDVLQDYEYYAPEELPTTVPRVASVREAFQSLPPESLFSQVHMSTCHTCGGSRQRGQIVHCQGCSLSYHKLCLGPRNARDHLVTKIGEDDFVLQCKFCINVVRKKEPNAPKQSLCQVCKGEGLACKPFSEKKTPRQEEKLRDENNGVDLISEVQSELVKNEEIVLFRCVTCHRGWHQAHLPPMGQDSVTSDLDAARLQAYKADWQCIECSARKHKILRLVAWRPSISSEESVENPLFEDLSDDQKEYLVKWESLSYFQCTWMPGAWVFGCCASRTKSLFAKRTTEENLLIPRQEDAIPDELLMPDIVFQVQMQKDAKRPKSKDEALENMANVSKMLIKFQGLGYDEVVWESVPEKGRKEIDLAFENAYREYLEGKYFQHEPYNKIRDRVKQYKPVPFQEVDVQPSGLKRGKLMGYQMEGLNWLLGNFHDGRSVVLADEMGLGKTVQVVGLVAYLSQERPKCWPFLIVVPNATCSNWRREFKQWAPDLRVVTYYGGRESQELTYQYELFPRDATEMKAHVVVMSYDSAQDPRTKTLFKSVHWAGLVVDEGQRLKNDQNLLYQALRAMKIPFRLLLTGTPLQNNKRELFNLLHFIDETQDAASLDAKYDVLTKENLPELHDKIRPYFLRRTKAGVLKFLPPMAQIILPVTLTIIQEKLCKSIVARNPKLIQAIFSNQKMKTRERSSLNNILIQLRRCLCHPFMYSEAIEERNDDPEVVFRNLVEASGKLILLRLMLPKLHERGHRVLIFSQFLQQLDILEDFLSGMNYEFRRLDGGISSLEKQRRIDSFNAPDSSAFVFLLSTRAGGVGINLATADTVIIMDPDFNPHQDIQALSRAHRIGQKRKVLCFQFMTKDTVEERIMQVGRKKMALDHALIESMDDTEPAGDDLESILKHGAQALFADDQEKSAIHYDDASVEKLIDRSQIEQTKVDDEGSAETQFSYAKVWANAKSSLEGLETIEEQAPLPISSSVWDRILEEREAEARQAEASREVLGRGGRRRNAINYQANEANAALENALQGEGFEPVTSESSDEFQGDDSEDESHDGGKAAKKDGQANGQAAGQVVDQAVDQAAGQADVTSNAGEAKPPSSKSVTSKSVTSKSVASKPPGAEDCEAAKPSLTTKRQQKPLRAVKATQSGGGGEGGGGEQRHQLLPGNAPAVGSAPQGWFPPPVPAQPFGHVGRLDGHEHANSRFAGYYHQQQPWGTDGSQPPFQAVNQTAFLSEIKVMNQATILAQMGCRQPRARSAGASPQFSLRTQPARSHTESQLRLEMDKVQHSQLHPTAKRQNLVVLLDQVRRLRMSG